MFDSESDVFGELAKLDKRFLDKRFCVQLVLAAAQYLGDARFETGLIDGRIKDAAEVIELGSHGADDDAAYLADVAYLAEQKANRKSIPVVAIDMELAALIIETLVHGLLEDALLERMCQRPVPEAQKPAPAGVLDAAARSRPRHPHPLVVCRELAWLARDTVTDVLGSSRAKEIQQEATGGKPLGICDFVHARGKSAGEPCLEIYPDRVFPAGRKPNARPFRKRCAAHAKGHHTRRKERLKKAEERKQPAVERARRAVEAAEAAVEAMSDPRNDYEQWVFEAWRHRLLEPESLDRRKSSSLT
jgi:hypothetical protein